ncbi:uncharacterized protein LOC129572275 [Sitodiplosis mosellana]|uniref:uncharacterized protein LOC129572275 n=1 Tax=Sitodiplosis mosellana TaxID=263140 RepID=UPI002443A874|nr:uncharacterized protein LOC129572275 [Sitodiplosis mosellana]
MDFKIFTFSVLVVVLFVCKLGATQGIPSPSIPSGIPFPNISSDIPSPSIPSDIPSPNMPSSIPAGMPSSPGEMAEQAQGAAASATADAGNAVETAKSQIPPAPGEAGLCQAKSTLLIARKKQTNSEGRST